MSISVHCSPATVVLLVVASAQALVGQRPVITPEGLVNAASLSADPGRGAVVAPGRLLTLFGQALAETAEAAKQVPLPTTLAGVTVTVDGVPAPLLYVSPRQINFQVPFATSARVVPVVVTTAKGASDPIAARLVFDAPGIFTREGAGCGHGAILNVALDGSTSVNGPSQSAAPGGYIAVFGTGFGPVYNQPPDGWAAASDILSIRPSPVVYLGLEGAPSPVLSLFAGLAPGLVGVDQVNVQLPWDVPQGCAVPLWISGVSVNTQPVMVSIRQGGGPCVEAPAARIAQLTWTRTIVTRPGEPAASERESFSAVFREGAENWLRATPNPEAGQWRSFSTKNPAPRCGLYAGANVDAGALTIRTPANDALVVRPTRSGTGEFLYEQALPAGSMQPGVLSVESQGSATVGPISSTRVLLPPPLRILTDLRPGTIIDPTRPLRLEWTGGRIGDLVNVRLLSFIPLGYTVGLEVYAWAQDGSLVLETREPPLGDGPRLLPLLPTDEFSVIVRVLPRSGTLFSAPGLTLFGRHEWVYEYHFLGLKLRQQAQ